jgi:hypothetical protein
VPKNESEKSFKISNDQYLNDRLYNKISVHVLAQKLLPEGGKEWRNETQALGEKIVGPNPEGDK